MKGPRLLIVCHYFEPSSETGAIRSTRLARFLLHKGLRPGVVTAASEFYGARVHLDGAVRREVDVFEVPRGALLRRTPVGGPAAAALRNAALVRAYAAAIERAVRTSDPFDLLYLCGHPFWYFPLARHFRLRHGLRYVLDFADVFYMGRTRYRMGQRSGLRQAFDRAAEAWAVQGASLVVHTTDLQTRMYRERYETKPARDFVTVRWGYDAEALAGLDVPPKPRDDVFRIAIFGKFASYCAEDSRQLARAVARLHVGRRVQVVHLGAPEPELEAAFRREGLLACFQSAGMQPYAAGMRELPSADCLVLNAISDVSLPAKVYDYIALNRPIVAFAAPESALGQLLGRFSGAFLAATAEQALDAFTRIADRRLAELQAGLDTAEFSQQYQFEKLLRALRSLVPERSPWDD